jgi:cell division protein FtsW
VTTGLPERQRGAAPAVAPGPPAGPAGPAAQDARVPPLQRPLASFYLLLASSGLLLFLGLVMVFSASSVRSFAVTGSSSTLAVKQAIFIAIGLPLAYAASRAPVRFWRSVARPAMVVAVLLLVAVLTPLGKEVDGTQGWIPLPGGFNLQPGEAAKLALTLWGADLLVRKQKLLRDWRHLFVPLLPGAALLGALIMLQPDMGMTVALLLVVVALLWVAGTPLRYFGILCGVLATLFTLLAVAAPYRMRRLTSFLDPFADAQDSGFQAVQSMYAIASGGMFGLGLGGGQSKWTGGLPATHTDFIFAVICEELGLVGALAVLTLIATFTYAGVRVAKRTRDPFVRYAATAVTAVFAGQSLINLGGVVGLLPITGITLPLVSFGGSSMLTTLVAVGMLLSFARHEPGAQAALRARPGLLGRSRAAALPRQRTASRAAARAASGGAGRPAAGTTGRPGSRPVRRARPPAGSGGRR